MNKTPPGGAPGSLKTCWVNRRKPRCPRLSAVPQIGCCPAWAAGFPAVHPAGFQAARRATRWRQQGQEEGRKQGYEAGLKEGRDAGYAQGVEQARVEQQALLREAETWVSNFKLALENLEGLIPARLVQLSLTAVQQLYGTSRVADNHALVTQIRSLMQQDALLHGTIQLYVHTAE